MTVKSNTLTMSEYMNVSKKEKTHKTNTAHRAFKTSETVSKKGLILQLSNEQKKRCEAIGKILCTLGDNLEKYYEQNRGEVRTGKTINNHTKVLFARNA